MAKKVNKEESTAKKTVAKKETKTKATTKKPVAKKAETKTTKPSTTKTNKTKKANEDSNLKVAVKVEETKKSGDSNPKKTEAKKVDSKKVTAKKSEDSSPKKVVAKKTTTKKKASKKEVTTGDSNQIGATTEVAETTAVESSNQTEENTVEDSSNPTMGDSNQTDEGSNPKQEKPTSTAEEFVKSTVSSQTVSEKPKKKKNILLRVIIAILLIVCACGIALMCLANNITALEEHYDPIDEYKSQLVVSEEDQGKSKEVLLAVNLINNITFDEETLDATLAVTKPVVYNFFDLDTLNNSEIIKNNKLVVNQFGYDLDPENSQINIYAAVKYNNFLNVGIKAQLQYEFTDTDLVITFKDAQIGNLPAFLYKSKLPAEGTELFRQNISDFNVVNDIKVRLLEPSKIKDIKYEDDTVYISLNIEEAMNDIINDLFDTSNGNSKFAQIANYYLQQLFNGNSDIDYTSMIDGLSSWVQEVIGEVDLDSLGNLIGLLGE